MDSREKTVEEVQEEVINHTRSLIEYWDKQSGSTYDKLEGLAFSIFSMLDGCSMLPAFKVSPMMADGDKEYYIENGENYYPENIDIAGELHSLFMKSKKE